MKKITVLLLAVLATNTLSAQILDSLRVGAKSINYEVIAASGYEDFAAAPYGDQLLFVSSRETGLFSKKYDLNNQKFFDLYLYNLKTKEVARYGDQLASLEKSKFHLGPATLLPDSAGVVLSRNYKIPNLEDEVNFYLVYENWSTNERYTLPFCTMANSFQHPFYDAKTRRLYFSTNLPEGPGGYDIYYSEFLKDGSWGTPVIVQGINGPRDDVFPTVSKDGRLFFSRTESQMGLNIYAFDFDSKEITSFAAPINTSGDDFSLIVLNSDSAVFSQSQGGRYNTDLVLAWVKGSGVSDIELPNVIASTPNSDDGAAESAVLESTDDGELTVAINTENPSSEEMKLNSVIVALTGSASECVAEYNTIKDRLSGEHEVSLVRIDGQLCAMLVSDVSKDQATQKVEAFKSDFGYRAYVSTSKVTVVSEEEYLNALSVVSGVFSDPNEATTWLKSVQKWSPDAFVSNTNGKYYVVSSVAKSGVEAKAAIQLASENGIEGAWIMRDELIATSLPNIQGAPDLVVYFKFDDDNLQEKFQQQIAAVMDELPADLGNVFMIGHTDSRGSRAYNDRLSMDRVKSVSNFINSNFPAFTAGQILHHTGERNLANECLDGVDCDEYAHYLNRRVEIWFY
jgi:outer membrane protein OmpA-like peptidoglycan-associated protein